MYHVIRTEAGKDLMTEKATFAHFKACKTLKSALKVAYNKNEQISTKVLGETYIVYDVKNNQLLRSELK